MQLSHSEILRNTLATLLASQLGEYAFIGSNGLEIGRSPSIRLVPPQVPDNIKMQVVGDRGIECLIYQDPRIEPTTQVTWEYYEVALRQHNLNQPSTKAKILISRLFAGVTQIRKQQGQIQGEITLEQVSLEIPRFHNFDDDFILGKVQKLLAN